jgi:signal transduction histidine kinase
VNVKGNSLGFKLLRLVFGSYFLVTLVVTIAQMASEYLSTQEQIKKSLVSLEDSFKASLSEALWQYNFDQIDTIVTGMMKIDLVLGVRITNERGRDLVQRGSPPTDDRDRTYLHTFNLTHPGTDGNPRILGVVAIYSGHQVVFDRVEHGFALILVNSVIKTLCLWLIFLVFTKKIIVKPLNYFSQVVEQSARLDENSRDNLAKLSGLAARKDEIGDLSAKYVQMYQEILRTTEHLQIACDESERLSRLKDDFLIMLSHELRTPLVPIIGWTQLLMTGELGTEETARALHTIERNANLQLQLVNDLLDASKILANKLVLEKSTVELMDVVKAAIDTVELSAQAKDISIDVHVERPVPAIEADSKRLQQALLNLLTNAIKFTKKSGRIKLTIDHQGQMAVLKVSDTGIGIQPAFLPFVFERFRQASSSTAREFGGLGLGLSLVKDIIELHDGEVSASSNGVDSGATFVVLLPISPGRGSMGDGDDSQAT